MTAPCVLRAERYALSLSTLYCGCPVYLVGGSLTDPDPRDIDLVVVVPDDLFLAMYGDEGETLAAWNTGWAPEPMTALWHRWARDVAKTNREGTRFCMRKVDFKVQPQSFFDTLAERPRRRLDLVGDAPDGPSALPRHSATGDAKCLGNGAS